MVRLKEMPSCIAALGSGISIPYGAIKS